MEVGRIRPEVLICYGGQGRNRTTDTRIFSPLLYQLSYLAKFSVLAYPVATRPRYLAITGRWLGPARTN